VLCQRSPDEYRERFTAQFKAKLAMEAVKGQWTIEELEGLYQVHPSRIAAWKKHLFEYSAMAFEESSGQGLDHLSPALAALLYESRWRSGLQEEDSLSARPVSRPAYREYLTSQAGQWPYVPRNNPSTQTFSSDGVPSRIC
jgi:transposase